MATDAEVNALFGQPCSWGTRCRHCRTPLVIVGCWHPNGPPGADVVLGCPTCKATENGGAP